MSDSKTYLNVPFAQKDEAKALGARWEPAVKKWYVPAGKDLGLFARWLGEDSTPAKPSPAKPSKTASTSAQGAITCPTGEAFVAYCGDEAPWE